LKTFNSARVRLHKLLENVNLTQNIRPLKMKPDMTVGWQQHLRNGNVHKVMVELAMQGGKNESEQTYDVEVHVVAPNSDLAQYIVTTMYPDYESITIVD
jgi:hypothetical protein